MSVVLAWGRLAALSHSAVGSVGCGGLVSVGSLQVRALGSLGPQLPIAEVSGRIGVNSGKALGGDPLPHTTPWPGLAGGHCEVRRRG